MSLLLLIIGYVLLGCLSCFLHGFFVKNIDEEAVLIAFIFSPISLIIGLALASFKLGVWLKGKNNVG